MDNIKVSIPIIGEEELTKVREVLLSGNYTSGKYVDQFEKNFAEYVGTKYAIACNSGTAAIHLALIYYNIGWGNEVIVPSMSFFATVSPVLMRDAIPVFADVDDYCNMDADGIEELITEDTKAIMPVHYFGMPCDMDKIMSVAKKYGLIVIEDCAQAHGAKIDGKTVGSFGNAGCFSFFATKNMTTIEGGMITTNDEEMYKRLKQIRSHGMTDRHTHTFLGYNYRMNEVSGVVGIEQLKRLDGFNEKRFKNSLYIYENIKSDKILPLYRDIIESNKECVFFWCPVITIYDERDDFLNHLKENSIGFRHRYNEPLYKQPVLKNRYKDILLPRAEHLSKRVVGLPNHPELTSKELNRIIKVVNDF
jgi:dTDP-4-amino-4,6-dideoxygalactose transaminase